MKDIENAYIAEKEYINCENNQLSLLEIVQSYGFDDLTDYFNCKHDYLIRRENLTVTGLPLSQAIESTLQAVQDEVPSAFMVKDSTFKTWAWLGTDEINNDGSIEEYNFYYNGGTIITNTDDFNVAIITPAEADVTDEYFLLKLVDYLKSKEIDASVQGNDVIVDNRKVAGAAFYTKGNVHVFIAEVTLCDHHDDIKKYCVKRPVKYPGFLSAVTRDELEEEVNRWLHTT